MYINKNGEITDKAPDGLIEHNPDLLLKIKYRVRVIHDVCGKKKVVGEEDYDNYPTTNQVMYCLQAHAEDIKNDFATVEIIYTTENELPFD